MVIAVISPGEMGSAVGRRLAQSGHRVITSLDGRSARTLELAGAAGIEHVGSLGAVVREADVLFSILPPGRAVDLARAVGHAPDLVYVDCNAVSPATVREIAGVIGDRFVDAGIIGFPDAPRFYASGAYAPALAGLPLDWRVIGPQVGQASALKMCYAAITKGLTALLTQSLVAAESLGLSGLLRSELADSQPQLWAMAERMVPGMVPKAYRWIAEMEEIADTFASVGLTPKLHEGAAAVYRFVEEGTEARGFEEVLAELSRRLSAQRSR